MWDGSLGNTPFLFQWLALERRLRVSRVKHTLVTTTSSTFTCFFSGNVASSSLAARASGRGRPQGVDPLAAQVYRQYDSLQWFLLVEFDHMSAFLSAWCSKWFVLEIHAKTTRNLGKTYLCSIFPRAGVKCSSSQSCKMESAKKGQSDENRISIFRGEW